jgi:hypothetical protein
VGNGHADGLQRDKCRVCGRTFNALTGTALARLRQRETWLEQASVPEAGLRVRRAAEPGVHRSTELRPRHRFLRLASAVRATARWPMWPRPMGPRPCAPIRGRAAKRGLSGEQVPIPVLRECSGQTADFVLEPAAAHIAQHAPHSARGERCRGPRAYPARQRLSLSRYQNSMHRFNGVATSYLVNSLGGFPALEGNTQRGLRPQRSWL